MNDNKTFHAADEYDSHIHATIPFYTTIHQQIIGIIRSYNPDPATWLDTGCGTGTLVHEAVKLFPATRFFLYDPSEAMLTIARKKHFGHTITTLGSVDTVHIDKTMHNLFDIVTAILSHHYLNREERSVATKKCFDLLKTGGVYISFENTAPLTLEGETIFRKYWKEFQIASGKSENKAREHMDRYNVEYFPIRIDEHINILQSSGFRVVELFWHSYMQSGFFCIK